MTAAPTNELKAAQLRQMGYDDGYAGKDPSRSEPLYLASHKRGIAAKERDIREMEQERG